MLWERIAYPRRVVLLISGKRWLSGICCKTSRRTLHFGGESHPWRQSSCSATLSCNPIQRPKSPTLFLFPVDSHEWQYQASWRGGREHRRRRRAMKLKRRTDPWAASRSISPAVGMHHHSPLLNLFVFLCRTLHMWRTSLLSSKACLRIFIRQSYGKSVIGNLQFLSNANSSSGPFPASQCCIQQKLFLVTRWRYTWTLMVASWTKAKLTSSRMWDL